MLLLILAAIIGGVKVHQHKKKRRGCYATSDDPTVAQLGPRQRRGCCRARRQRRQNRRWNRWGCGQEPVFENKELYGTGQEYDFEVARVGPGLPPPYEDMNGKMTVVGEEKQGLHGDLSGKEVEDGNWVDVERPGIPRRSSKRVSGVL